jgi:molybdopterin molybdotransferase
MISVRDAQDRILARATTSLPPEVILLADAPGRTLAADVWAPFDVPPRDNSAVDGYAIASADICETGTGRLRVVADIPAGAVLDAPLGPGEAVKIMTGAPIPAGTDTVVPVENVHVDAGSITITAVAKGQNVRLRGEDVREGSTVLEAGSVLRPQDVGLLAALGIPHVLARRKPRVAVLSTGDEVVEPGQPRQPGQIYDSNRYLLRGAIEQCGAVPLDLGIVADDRTALEARLREAGASSDVVVTSGGVSVGDYDLVKTVLHSMGGIDFWQVAMQPGRPVAAGRLGNAHFVGLPGNPVAAMLAFGLFVRPLLFKLGGRRDLFPDGFHARATEPIPKKVGRREYKRGILRYRDGAWEVRTTGPQGSGILTSLVAANCLIILDEARSDIAPGEAVWVELL